MEPKIVNLGKVCPTTEGEHDNTREYDYLCIIYDGNTERAYISRKFVPEGILLTDKEYWQPFGSVPDMEGYATEEYVNNKIEESIGSYTEEQMEEDFNNIFY